MKNSERKLARRYDTPYRCHGLTEGVYGGYAENKEKMMEHTLSKEKEFYPEKTKYKFYFGDIHGHTALSDGRGSIDDYFKDIRDNDKFDFAALTDHDHGGIGNEELFAEKWEITKQKVKEYNEPGKFTTILGYEKDSYPWYNNLVIYYDNYDGEMLSCSINGEITKEELACALKREDVLLVPHDTYSLTYGVDFNSIDGKLFTPLIEIYSGDDSAEFFGNPHNLSEFQCEGGFWQDALKRGARMGCIAASDNHERGCADAKKNFYAGKTGVLAKENTLSSIFAALKARRCYGFIGEKMKIDFRINGHYMGEEFSDCNDRAIYINIESDAEIKRVTLVKNCRDYIIMRKNEVVLFDYRAENETDYYYLRVELKDGSLGWTSPIWINQKKLTLKGN